MSSYLRLIRIPNLLILAFGQFAVQYLIIRPVLSIYQVDLQLSALDFAMLVISTVLLAAAGYAINDYYDVESDRINKPGKNMASSEPGRRRVYVLYISMNIIACVLGFVVAFRAGSFKLGFVQVVLALVLFYYSLKYKRLFLTGNIVVSLITAFSLLMVWLFEFFAIKQNPEVFTTLMGSFGRITWLVGGLSAFAFLTNLIREIVKDAEDVEGDRAMGCNTLAVNSGTGISARVAALLTLLTVLLLAVAQYFLYLSGYGNTAGFLLVAQALLVYILVNLFRARTRKQFSFVSNMLKILFVAGICAAQTLYLF